MNNLAGIIFSNLHDKKLPRLTRERTMGSVPFACRYRMIDFPISAMVNCGIENIYVIAHHNYHSLTEHIGSGKDYDLARRSGGIHILTPMMNAFASDREESYDSRLKTLISVLHTIDGIEEKYLLMTDTDAVYNMDVRKLLRHHTESGNDFTFYRSPILASSPFICICEKSLLRSVLSEAAVKGYTSFFKDIIDRDPFGLRVGYYERESPMLVIHSTEDYYRESMRILRDGEIRRGIFSLESAPIFSRHRNPPCVKYLSGADVSGSLIADGCEIGGRVENSIIFRKVRIGKGAVIRNSIIFEQTTVMNGAHIDCVITGKGSAILEGVSIISHSSMPAVISSGRIVG